jgi:RNA-directed DNA polymerase
LGDLRTPDSVQKLQSALQAKAKAAPAFRFYSLYDKVYRVDVLEQAYRRCRANGGAAGVDGQDFENIEAYGIEGWIGELAQTLKEQTYRVQAIRRVYIPKPNGKLRPLGIPTIRDRVAQTAAMLILEPIFETDMQPEQYAYRADRSALDAIRQTHRWLNSGYKQVIEADLTDYFGSIPHAELLKCVARRVVDRRLLHLIRMWLQAPVQEPEERGQKRVGTGGETRQGIPQGAPISPLLSNLYMRRFVLGWKRLGYEERLEAHIVNYADDLVICCRARAEEALAAMRRMMQRLKLTVNEEKTRLAQVPRQEFDFLGYTFGHCYAVPSGRCYLGNRPSKRSVQRLKRALSAATDRRTLPKAFEEVVQDLNRMLRGWGGYFCLGSVGKAYRGIDRHTIKSTASLALAQTQTNESCAHRFGTLRADGAVLAREVGPSSALEARLNLVREPDAGNLHVRFDEREVETEARCGYSGTGVAKGPATDNVAPNPTALPLDSTADRVCWPSTSAPRDRASTRHSGRKSRDAGGWSGGIFELPGHRCPLNSGLVWPVPCADTARLMSAKGPKAYGHDRRRSGQQRT